MNKYNYLHVLLFMISFQVFPKNIDIYNQDEVTISIYLTVPFYCTGREPRCTLNVLTYIPGSSTSPCQITRALSVKYCGVLFEPADVNTIKNMTIWASIGTSHQAYYQQFEILLQVNKIAHPFMHGSHLDKVRVCISFSLLYSRNNFKRAYKKMS